MMSELAIRQSWEGKLAATPNGEAARAVVVEITAELGANAETEAWVVAALAPRFERSGDWVRTWFTKERIKLAIEARAAEITKGLEAAEAAQPEAQAQPEWTAELDPIHKWEVWIDRGLSIVTAGKATIEEVAEYTERIWKDGAGQEFREKAAAFF